MSDELTPMTDDAAVAILSTPTPGELRQWRAEDPARRMYSNNAEFAELIPDSAFEGAEAPREKRQAAVTEFRAMLADTGLSPSDARTLLSRSAHAKADGKSLDEIRRETREQLVRQYGSADQALADVKKLINRDPRFARYISAKGIDRDPEAILILARAARSQRMSGRLK